MEREYAKKLLHREGWAVQAKASTWTISNDRLLEAGQKFFDDLQVKAKDVDADLLLNSDKFCLLLMKS